MFCLTKHTYACTLLAANRKFDLILFIPIQNHQTATLSLSSKRFVAFMRVYLRRLAALVSPKLLYVNQARARFQ